MNLVLFVLLIIGATCHSQVNALVYLEKKDTTKSKLALSSDAIKRKSYYHIPIDDKDYAINKDNLFQLSQLSNSTKPVNWFNAVFVNSTRENLEKISKLDFVTNYEILSYDSLNFKVSKNELKLTEAEYGETFEQLNIHDIPYLHSQNFMGQGMKIAVLDAGYLNIDSSESFKKAFDEGRIHPVWNVVYNSDSLKGYGGHGTGVLGCMASYTKDICIGSAPMADYYLFVTEDERSETKAEEVYWSIAAQKADSLGVDIINSSLGYSTFNDPSTNYTYKDMDGKTTIVSKAAQIAVDKGIIVVNSAGNEGDKPWHYITAPADVKDVISVGAIDVKGVITNFSSRGYNANNEIKPTVVAVGRNSVQFAVKGTVNRGNGTSFSSPTMAGMIACLWQYNKTKTPSEVRETLIKSASQYSSPDENYGFGIPNCKKYTELVNLPDSLIENELTIFPNPCQKQIVVSYQSSIEIDALINIYWFDKLINSTPVHLNIGINRFYKTLDMSTTGLHFVELKFNKNSVFSKFIKE